MIVQQLFPKFTKKKKQNNIILLKEQGKVNQNRVLIILKIKIEDKTKQVLELLPIIISLIMNFPLLYRLKLKPEFKVRPFDNLLMIMGLMKFLIVLKRGDKD